MSNNTVQGICQLQGCSKEVTGEFEYYSTIYRRVRCFGYCDDHIKMMFGRYKQEGYEPRMIVTKEKREKVVFT